MNSIKIYYHSFVDLITNSSSETFVTADEKTLKAIKEIVGNVLKLGGSEKTADELFDFTLMIEEGSFYDNEKNKYVDYKETDYFSPEGKKIWREVGDSESSPALYVKVTAKNKEEKDAVKTAKLLSTINDFFNTETRYN